jgi:hypothetical protein
LTVIVLVATAVPQVFDTEYEITDAPADTPVTMPVAPTVAMAAALLLHIPPGDASETLTELPGHTPDEPEIVPATGDGFVVNTLVAMQPVGSVYVIFVVPGATPVTTPETGSMVATEVEPALHEPPIVASLTVADAAWQTLAGPDIAAGNGFTVTMAVVLQPVDKV